jgi:Zn finger protein HypA/HybF involved in hydrogenase expression
MSEDRENNEKHEVGLYEKLASRTAELLEAGRTTLDDALKRARQEMTKAGEFSEDQMARVASYVKRDIMKDAHRATKAVRDAIDPHRVAAGAQSIFSRILTSAADALSDLAKKAEEQLEFKTGEVTSPGTLTCQGCQTDLHMKTIGRIPPCPKCHKTVFRKSY